MDPNSSDHVVNIIEMQECNIPSQEICLEKEINDSSETNSVDTATQVPETTDASETNSVESSTCEADRSLLSGSKKEYMEICVPLNKAARTGDWVAAKPILEKRPELVRFAITRINGNTTLHVAVKAEATKQGINFVEKVVEMMQKEDLEIVNDSGKPAYMIAAESGNVDMVKVMIKKHEDLLSKFQWPTLEAVKRSAQKGNHAMALYLYNVLEETPPSFWTDVERCLFFKCCIEGNLFDIALEVLKHHRGIVGKSKRICFITLDALARRPDAINRTETVAYKIWRIADSILAFFHVKKSSPEMDSQALQLVKSLLELYPISSQPDICAHVPMYIDWNEVPEEKISSNELLLTAAEMGNTRFVIELLRMFPDAIDATKEGGISISHIAIKCRNKDIYNLLKETGSLLTNWLDNKTRNNILHYVAMTSQDTAQLQTVSGASLLMQQELLWYMEIEKMVPPLHRNAKNQDGKTPYEMFSENNKELVEKGLQWTRDCMLVATLIITVAFAVAFTHPGGYNQETGIPIFERHRSFLVFLIADSISFIASSTSLLVFLSILTSPRDQRDFLYAMPGKLMIGLVTLFMSVAAMMVTFSASFFVLYQNTNKKLAILINVFAAIPVIIYAALQYPFVKDMFRSTYDSRYLFNTRRRVLYE